MVYMYSVHHMAYCEVCVCGVWGGGVTCSLYTGAIMLMP